MTPRTVLLPLALVLLLALAGCTDDQGDPAAGPATGSAATAAVQSDPAPPFLSLEGVTVTGHGRVPDAPDTLRATVGVHVVRADVDTAFADANAAAERVLAALRDAGVADEDIQTRELSVRPEHEHRPEGPPEVTGYAVRNLVEVTITDVDQAGELLGAVADAGGDDARIERLWFDLEDNEEQLQAAREAAFEDARSKAEHYAGLADRELGPLVSVTETGADLPPPTEGMDTAVAADEAAGAAPIMPGEQEVGVQVQARWSLVD